MLQRFEEDCGWGYVTYFNLWTVDVTFIITYERFPPNPPDIFEFKLLLMISAHIYKENAVIVIR